MSKNPSQDRKRWLNHHHYRTYEIALRITQAVGLSADLRDLDYLHDWISVYLQPWQKESAIHRFAAVIANEMFAEDTQGPYVEVYEPEEHPAEIRRYLPVDIAMRAYGVGDGEMFEVPERDGTTVREGNVSRWVESSKVADACFDYTFDLQMTEAYDRLLEQITDEVFHTVFPNRALLSRLHEVLAIYVGEIDPESLVDEPELAGLFSREGVLKRVRPPRWARRAVFFRDHGHCAICGTDLTGLIDPLPAKQFDHIVPLDRGGLNDVSNLQLLCQPCNSRKSSKLIQPGVKYRRYYER